MRLLSFIANFEGVFVSVRVCVCVCVCVCVHAVKSASYKLLFYDAAQRHICVANVLPDVSSCTAGYLSFGPMEKILCFF